MILEIFGQEMKIHIKINVILLGKYVFPVYLSITLYFNTSHALEFIVSFI
jgi:hypothetical protein